MSAPPQRAARLGDVAREAGVHVSTVSRVINGRAPVSIRPETRARILQTAERLRYRPHALARGLKLATTGALGLLVPSLRNPVNSEIVRGAFDRAWSQGYVLVLAEDPGEGAAAEEAYARLVDEGRIDGLIVQSARAGNPLLDRFASGSVPCVFVDRRHPGSSCNVSMRDDEAGRLVAAHFLELGHRRLAHLAGPLDLDTTRRRHDGYLEAARQAGAEPTVEVAGMSERDGYEAMSRLLRPTGQRPTAIYVANLNQAVGAVAAARALGVAIPEAVSVVCHDDDPLCDFLHVPVTAVHMPLLELGAAAVDALLAQIAEGRRGDVLVGGAPRLALRRSTAPPGAPAC